MDRFVGLGISVAGLAVAAWGGYGAWLQYSSTEWVQVTGVVEAAYVGGSAGSGNTRTRRTDTRITGSSESQGRAARYPVIEFTYTVDGEQHHGDNLLFGMADWGQAGSEVEVARFPTGSEVIVWYDPGDPSRSTLDKGDPPVGQLLFALFGIVLMIAGVFAHRRIMRSRA